MSEHIFQVWHPGHLSGRPAVADLHLRLQHLHLLQVERPTTWGQSSIKALGYSMNVHCTYHILWLPRPPNQTTKFTFHPSTQNAEEPHVLITFSSIGFPPEQEVDSHTLQVDNAFSAKFLKFIFSHQTLLSSPSDLLLVCMTFSRLRILWNADSRQVKLL